jgi:hypothetical protein
LSLCGGSGGISPLILNLGSVWTDDGGDDDDDDDDNDAANNNNNNNN